MTIHPATESDHRIAVLDSVRGIAALTVVIHHFLVSTPRFWAAYGDLPQSGAMALLSYSPLHLAWGGLEAVLLFFVLSGFVLAIPFQRGKVLSYSGYAVKRICRIYLPYIFAVLGGAVILNSMPSHRAPAMSTWFNQFWNQNADWHALADHALMLGSIRRNYMNPVIWSLVHEMRVSLIFPFLMWIVFRFSWRIVVPAALAFSLGSKMGIRFVHADNLLRSVLETASYLFLFVAGAELSVNRKPIRLWFAGLKNRTQGALLLISLLSLNARWEMSGRFAVPALLFMWTGAIGVIGISAISPAVGRALDYAPFRWLGRVSYSLYLTHIVVLFGTVYLLRGRLPVALALIAAFPLALLVSEGYYRLVEARSIRIGKALERRIDKPPAAREFAHSAVAAGESQTYSL